MKKSLILAVSIQAQADLQTIGTATYGGADYNLIYDDDYNITWLDYSNAETNWYNQMSWYRG